MSFTSSKPKIYEQVTFTQPNGDVYKLHSPPNRVVMDMTGWGKAPHDMYSSSGPYQHGMSPVAYRLKPRTIDFTINHKFCSRSEWFAGRSELLSNLSINTTYPDAPVPGTLSWVFLQDGLRKVRCLDCFLTKGLAIDPLQGRVWDVQESLSFEALNPIVYDPSVNSVNMIASLTEELIFPVTFPFVLGSYYTASGVSITYGGTWETYPVITIVGPATGVYFENRTTGTKIRFDYSVSLNETVTIDLAYDRKTVTNNYGENLAQYIKSSDLGQFALLHDPLVTGGINLLYLSLDGYALDNTSITLSYYNRYFGI